ncbi:hypothetical protein JXL19_13215 [bacterium]|nr:hypothetical protein [bacterium]
MNRGAIFCVSIQGRGWKVQSMQMGVKIGCPIAPGLNGYNRSRDCALGKAFAKKILYRLPYARAKPA